MVSKSRNQKSNIVKYYLAIPFPLFALPFKKIRNLSASVLQHCCCFDFCKSNVSRKPLPLMGFGYVLSNLCSFPCVCASTTKRNYSISVVSRSYGQRSGGLIVGVGYACFCYHIPSGKCREGSCEYAHCLRGLQSYSIEPPHLSRIPSS